MLATAMYEYKNKKYRCVWLVPFAYDAKPRIEVLKESGWIILAGDYIKTPRPGQFCKRPNNYINFYWRQK